MAVYDVRNDKQRQIRIRIIPVVSLVGSLFGVFNFEHGTLLAAAAQGLVGGGIYLAVSAIRDSRRDKTPA